MNLSSLQMMTQDCYSWKPREIKVCDILLEDTSVRGLTNTEFLCSQSYKHSCWQTQQLWVLVTGYVSDVGGSLSFLEFGESFEGYT